MESDQRFYQGKVNHPNFGEVSFSDLRSMLMGASWDLVTDHSSVFYCNASFTRQFWGKNQGEAFEGKTFAAQSGTITNTQGGKLLDSICADAPNSDIASVFQLPTTWAHQLTILSSSLYAQASKGDVLAFIHHATHRPPISFESQEAVEKASDKLGQSLTYLDVPLGYDKFAM